MRAVIDGHAEASATSNLPPTALLTTPSWWRIASGHLFFVFNAKAGNLPTRQHVRSISGTMTTGNKFITKPLIYKRIQTTDISAGFSKKK
jgi:hypothetical protein